MLAVLAGAVHGAHDVTKAHPYRVDAFSSGDAGPLGWMEEGVLRRLRPWPVGEPLGLAWLGDDAAAWPVVDIVTSHSGARAAVVEALSAAGANGLVIAATGNGSVHEHLDRALRAALRRGVSVLRATRCPGGPIVCGAAAPHDLMPTTDLSPFKARIELILQLMRPLN